MKKKLIAATLAILLSAGVITAIHRADKVSNNTGIIVAEGTNAGIIEPPDWK